MTVDPHLLNYRQCLDLVNREILQLEAQPLLPIPAHLLKHMTPPAWAFLTYTAKTLFMHGSFDPTLFQEWLTEGFDDASADLLPTWNVGDELFVGVVQCKYRDSVSATEVAALATAIDYVFYEKESVVKKLTNAALVARIREIRGDIRRRGPAAVTVMYVTRGKTQRLTSQVQREVERLQTYLTDNGRFAKVMVSIVGPQEIVAASISNTYQVPEKWLTLPYLSGPSAAIRHTLPTGGLPTTAVVCTASASALAKMVSGNEDWLFRENVRDFLGLRGNRVNKAITATATSAVPAGLFWLLNNGVTITCTKIVDRQDPDAPILSLLKPQIVNGCQTSEVLAAALASRTLRPEAHLLIKIVETENESLIDQITLATNSQSAVRKRDLHSNDYTQRALAIAFQGLGLIYQTKPGLLRIAAQHKHRLIHNEKCGQASLAVFLKAPSQAMSNKAQVWDDEPGGYHSIFDHPAIELLYAYRLVEYCERRRKILIKTLPRDSERVSDYVVRMGVFHMARTMSFLLLGGDSLPGNMSEFKFRERIAELERDSTVLRSDYERGRTVLARAIRRVRKQDNLKLVSCFKSEAINAAITAALHSLLPRKRTSRRAP
ncbi:MAG TPA: AIPR family protein [Thermoanaerobaculia bacterium]|jgi:hypothetical protein|nr:AIPR family protein [Thermoanaerobaculia bacterium]